MNGNSVDSLFLFLKFEMVVSLGMFVRIDLSLDSFFFSYLSSKPFVPCHFFGVDAFLFTPFLIFFFHRTECHYLSVVHSYFFRFSLFLIPHSHILIRFHSKTLWNFKCVVMKIKCQTFFFCTLLLGLIHFVCLCVFESSIRRLIFFFGFLGKRFILFISQNTHSN